MTLLKITLFCVLGGMQCVYAVMQGQKKHYFPHTVYYCCSSMPRLSEMRQFLKCANFYNDRSEKRDLL